MHNAQISGAALPRPTAFACYVAGGEIQYFVFS